MNVLVARHRQVILDLCRAYGVARLEVFGSVMTDAFDPDRSDVDFIVAYPPDYDFGPWLGRFQALEAALAAGLDRDVNLVMESALTNRWFAREAAKTRTVLYDASQIPEVRSGLTMWPGRVATSSRTPQAPRSIPILISGGCGGRSSPRQRPPWKHCIPLWQTSAVVRFGITADIRDIALAHGYDDEIEDALVWRAVKESLPALQSEVQRILPSFEP